MIKRPRRVDTTRESPGLDPVGGKGKGRRRRVCRQVHPVRRVAAAIHQTPVDQGNQFY